MKDEELEIEGKRLVEDVSWELRAGRSKKWRCPKELRSRVVSYARRSRERGESLRDIAERLGLVESTLGRWLRRDGQGRQAGFRSVAIIGSEEDRAPLRQVSPGMRLVTPHGYSVEGLDAETLVFLLRVIG